MRPYIICHMMVSVDGRIDCDMTEQIESGDEYYEALEQLECPSMLMGRVTMQMHYADSEPFIPNDVTPIGKESFYVACQSGKYCVAVDTRGMLRWPASGFDGQSLLVVVSEDCSAEYLDVLTTQGISWIATGKGRINLHRAMEMLCEYFGVERMAVTGGGHINGAFLQEGLLDEVSLMIAPGVDGRKGMTSVFDGIDDSNRPATKLKFRDVSIVGDNTVWIRYRV